MGFEFLLLLIGIVGFTMGHRRLRRLEDEVARLRDRVAPSTFDVWDAAPTPATPPPPPPPPTAPSIAQRTPARVVQATAAPPALRAPEPAVKAPPEPVAEPLPPPRRTLEALIGGQLPIWVGGAALVVAAFFLVRYSIESGLLSPGVRVALAGLFSVALIAASEVARRLPVTRDDTRIGQVLAGAGVASAYGTLYVAAAQYHLVGAVSGFLLMVAITAGALFLALRHGPPTAIMALIGGFAAPLVAGFEAAGLGPLLVYLALFIAALFALAAHRGWRWLALAALVAGFGWANLLIVLLDGRDTAGVGAFIVALAIGATLALPRTGATAGWLRVGPLIAGLVQLLILAPTLDFGPVAWTFHLVLAAAALILAWRDDALQPAAFAAACLVTTLVAAGLLAPDLVTTPVAAIVGALLFGGAGLALSRRSAIWAGVALVGIAGPVLTTHVIAARLLPDLGWSAIEFAAAGVGMLLAWRHRDRIDTRDAGLVGGTAVAALLTAVAAAAAAGPHWAPLAVAPVLLALGWWANRVADRDLARLEIVLLAAIGLLAAETLADWFGALGSAIAGTLVTYPMLPSIADVARMVAAPALAAAALFVSPRSYGAGRARVAGALAIVGILCLYTLVKQPLAIATDARFVAVGLAERAAITLAFAGAGWGLASRTRFRRSGEVLLSLALFRFVWFDLGIANPVIVAQQVGPLPVLNLAVLLPALLAVVTWRMPPAPAWRWAGLALVLVAVTASVRQIAHGTLLTGDVGSGENWGYSAALLALASVWLWRGLVTHQRDLRGVALALLTLVTIKVFLIDVAALGGLLRILSFMGLGLALIGIGWAYNRLIARPVTDTPQPSP